MSRPTSSGEDRPTSVAAALLTDYRQPPRPADRQLPAVGDRDCLIRVTAAPITPLDLLCASGTSYLGAPPLPYVPGVSGVGVVERGHSVASGSRVWFNTDAGMRPGDGSLAQTAVANEAETVPVPDGLADSVAAALGLSAVAAWMALTWKAQLREGERVLILGAGGVVGQVAVQAAIALGATAVVAASRREAARSRALSHGATAAVDLSGADVEELAARMLQAAGGVVDVVIDPVCGASATAALQVLGDGGRLVNLGSSGGASATFASAILRGRSQSILGYTNNSLTREQRADALSTVFELAGQGRCQVDHEVIGLDAVTDGWQRTGSSPDRRIVVVPRVAASVR